MDNCWVDFDNDTWREVGKILVNNDLFPPDALRFTEDGKFNGFTGENFELRWKMFNNAQWVVEKLDFLKKLKVLPNKEWQRLRSVVLNCQRRKLTKC